MKKEEEERKKWKWTSTVKRMLSCGDKRPRGAVHCRGRSTRGQGDLDFGGSRYSVLGLGGRERRLRIGSGGCLGWETKKLLNNRRGGARGDRECRRRGIKRVEREKSIRNGGSVRKDRGTGAQRTMPILSSMESSIVERTRYP